MDSPARIRPPDPRVTALVNELLKAELDARELSSYEKLAIALGVTAASVSRWRHGYIGTVASILLVLAEKFWRRR